MLSIICGWIVVVGSALSVPVLERRDFWSHVKHQVEHVAHNVGHAAETAAGIALANSVAGMVVGKRGISEEKRDFWSHLKHKAENVAHNVGHAAETAAGIALANSLAGMARGKRDISEEKRDLWSTWKDELESAAKSDNLDVGMKQVVQDDRREMEMSDMTEEINKLKNEFIDWWNSLPYLWEHQGEEGETISTGSQTGV